MQQIIMEMLSEIYRVALCLALGLADQSETQIDRVTNEGLMNRVIVRKTDEGFALHDPRKDPEQAFFRASCWWSFWF